MTQQQEKKNERIALLASVALHSLAFILMFFIIAWRAPNPPYGGEPGIELNFGLDTEGSGDVQPEVPVGSGGTQQEEPQQSEAEPVPPPQPPPQEVDEKLVTSEDEDAPAIAKEEKKEEKKPEPVKEPEKPKEVKKEPEKKVEVKPRTADPNTVYNPNAQKAQSSNKTGDGKAGAPGNHGDDKGKVGDKGNPQGTLDSDALYGQPGGGGGGGGVSMSGFTGFEWPRVQPPAMPDEAYGVYEFLVKVNEDGDVIKITPLQRGLSLDAERKLKAMIEKLVFIPKGSNLPPESEGKITFRVVAR